MSANLDLTGSLSFMNLGELLQIIGSSSATGTLRIISDFTSAPGVISIENGNPVNASTATLSGIEALFSLFGWSDGRFEFSLGPVNCEKTINKGRMEIILDGLRLLDEGKIEKIGPAPGAVIEKTEAPAPVTPARRADLPPLIKGPLVDYTYVVDEESFYDGDEIVHEGAHGDWIWVILEGAAEIIKTTPGGPLRLLRVGDGAFLGSVAALLSGDNVRGTTVIASGNIQLGMLNSQQLTAEIVNLPFEFKGLIKSLDNRLRFVTHIAAETHMRNGAFLKLIQDKKIALKEGQNEDRLFQIREGEVVVARSTESGYLPLAHLQKGDFFGNIPFLTLGHEPHAAAVFSSADLKLAVVDIPALEAAQQRLSSTLRHIIEHLSACISATTLVSINLFNKSGLS
ncbi:MAG TPA: cyclic nucleotide-binding domain-containing protein [Desulfobacterales bacterium]|nr:cyclic nucleotide-binding domain-containing protein [Desulfobacterales bacterium]